MHNLSVAIGSAAIVAGLGAGPASAEPFFNRIASWPVTSNLPAGTDPDTKTVAEIVDVTEDGRMVVYTDGARGVLGLIDITDPRAPRPAGTVAVGGEPTSVAVMAGRAFAVIDTSSSRAAPSGRLAVVDLSSRSVVRTCDLGGQPDAVAVSPDGSFVAVAIENQRDEDFRGGALPQPPPGNVTIVPIAAGAPDCGARRVVDLTGLARVAGDDPEPEYLDVNAAGEIVVTLQENNHIAVIDGRSGAVTTHFSAGAVDLDAIDTDSDRAITFDGSLRGRPREPDGVKWLDGDRFVTANEGDYEGGTRGFTIFSKFGPILHDSGAELDYEVAAIGHYPDKRSGKRGIEPEGIAVARMGGVRYFFVTVERASLAAVYKDTGGAPEFVQLLPSGVRPEGVVAIPSRNLLVTANEDDQGDGGTRSNVMIYELQDAPPSYPQIRSRTGGGHPPIAWGALSGLAADPGRAGILYAVNDDFYRRQPMIFTIDATTRPATIVRATRITRDGERARKLDPEGITSDGEGGFWVVSEGGPDGKKAHMLYHVGADGGIDRDVELPRKLKKVARRHGFEGIAAVGAGRDLTLWMAVQRAWKDDGDGFVKLVSYRPATGRWGVVRYRLDTPQRGWVGVSGLAAHGGALYVLERDNGIGGAARVKKLYRVALSALDPAPLGGDPPTVTKREARDLVPYLKALNGVVVEKVEGFAVDAAGMGYAVTDNDGVKDSSGETLFFSVGRM